MPLTNASGLHVPTPLGFESTVILPPNATVSPGAAATTQLSASSIRWIDLLVPDPISVQTRCEMPTTEHIFISGGTPPTTSGSDDCRSGGGLGVLLAWATK